MLQGVSTLTIKGQVTIPRDIRRRLGVGPRDKVAFVVEEDQVRIVPATSVVAQTAGILKGDRPALSPQEEKASAEQAIAEDAERRGRDRR